MTDDTRLLQEYASDASEPAFGTVVARYLDLVYSTALRRVGGDVHLAQDVAQVVFATLARKARGLPAEVVLGAWLYRQACRVSAQTVRTECRRRIREHEAAQMNALSMGNEPAWEQVEPFLDEALQGLGAKDRAAIVLRFFERREFQAVGAALGTTEEGARKRVVRALEKLRTFFQQRGLSLSAGSLAALLAGRAVTAAPAGLLAAVTSGALLSATSAGTGISAWLLKFMTMTKIKIGVASALLIAGLALWEVQRTALSQLRTENVALREQAGELERLRQENERLKSSPGDPEEMARLLKEHAELLRLRGEVGVLRQQAQAAARKSPTATPKEIVPTNAAPFTSFAANVQATVEDQGTVVTGGWSTKSGNRVLVFATPKIGNSPRDEGTVIVSVSIAEAAENVWASLGLRTTPSNTAENSPLQTLGAEDSAAMLKTLKETPGVTILSSPKVGLGDGTEGRAFVGTMEPFAGMPEPVHLGHTIRVLARMSADHKTVDLTLNAQYNVRNETTP